MLKLLCLAFVSCGLSARYPHELPRENMPSITVSWEGHEKTNQLHSAHLQEDPFFNIFNKEYLEYHCIPAERIVYRDDEKKSVCSRVICALIDNLLDEIRAKRRTFTDFRILQDKDFNYRKSYGLIILQFKHYPFVLKVFIETPFGLVHPFDKGFEPTFFFFMSGGTNRHLTGFTRFVNREIVEREIKKSTYWSTQIDLPRKWFLVPPSAPWIYIKGKNIACRESQEITMPGTYCILADLVQVERRFRLLSQHDRVVALNLCNYLNLYIDPHINNFVVDKKSKKIVIIDTEHFPTLVGFKTKKNFRSYLQWYFHLTVQCLYNMFFKTKKRCLAAQKEISLLSQDIQEEQKRYVMRAKE